jgi:hypothetical protein
MGPSGPLRPFVPGPLDATRVVDREIEEWTTSAGTYGMGGPGFVGFRAGADWLIIAVWGAGDWLRLDGRLLTDLFWEKHRRGVPWQEDPAVDFDDLFVGRRFSTLEVSRDSVTATLDDGRVLALSPDPADRPAFEGNGEARRLAAGDDLRRAVFTAPTTELWIGEVDGAP